MIPMELVMLISLLICATCTDLAGRKIPNLIVVSGFLIGTAFAALQGRHVLLSSLGGCILGMAFLLPFYAARGMAAGDVKLMGMAGAFLGVPVTVTAVVYVFAAGGVLAIGGWAMRWLQAYGASGGFTRSRSCKASAPAAGDFNTLAYGVAPMRLPYAVAITVGVGMALFTRCQGCMAAA